jgi:hypothetical protein
MWELSDSHILSFLAPSQREFGTSSSGPRGKPQLLVDEKETCAGPWEPIAANIKASVGEGWTDLPFPKPATSLSDLLRIKAVVHPPLSFVTCHLLKTFHFTVEFRPCC